MPAPVAVDSLDDPRLAAFRHLKDRQLAESMGLFIAEGEHLVRRMLAASPRIRPHALLVSDHRLHTIVGDVPIYVMPETRISEVIGYPFHLGMLACGHRPDLSRLDDLLDARTLVCCPHLQNVENLGVIVRTAQALGVDGLIVGDKGSDPFMRRCVRVSMGSVFSLPIVQTGRLERDLLRLRDERGAQLVATVLAEDAVPLQQYRRGERVVVLLGNEPAGLSERLVRLCTHKVTIPMHHGVDSLNVAVAAGIVLHHVAMGEPD
jgi:tRNA G18 (ribose-2'-O)-methylase SpoU